MTDHIAHLVTDDGFIEEFWKLIRSMPGATHEQVFEILNEEYRNFFGEDRFPSFDAFRKKRDRKYFKL